MQTFRRFTKPVSYIVTVGILALSLHLPVANATLVGTEAVVHATQVQQQRDRIHETLNREDVKAKLVALGVEPSQVQARVGALTDEETQRLAKSLDEMPAGGVFGNGVSVSSGSSSGGGIVGVLVVVLVILIITDLLGVTDVFGFLK